MGTYLTKGEQMLDGKTKLNIRVTASEARLIRKALSTMIPKHIVTSAEYVRINKLMDNIALSINNREIMNAI